MPAIPTPVNRNAPCPCGSGKRYKHCHGSVGAAAPVETRFEALTAQQAGAFGRAESLYRRALEENPDDVDSLHMLGVVQLERMRYGEALENLWQAAERTGWAIPQIRHNLGLVLAKLLSREANRRQADLLAAFVAWEHTRRDVRRDTTPLVSVVLPAYNHARYVARAIASVAAQSYPRIEFVVIDDGSTDGTPAVIAESVATFPFPVRFVARENRGAPATLNEGAALARGDYLAFLNSDDFYAPDRIATLVDEIARRDVKWGFTLVSQVGDDPQAEPSDAADSIDPCSQRQRNFLGRHPNSFTLAEYNVAISTGNLFVEREFFRSLGGFRDFRYNHDWDFCLRAAAVAEPIVVHRRLYCYRWHEANTIGESRQRPGEEADGVFAEFLAGALAGESAGGNPLAPQAPANRALLLRLAFGAGQGALVPIPVLKSLAAEWRTRSAVLPAEARGPRAAAAPRRTAVIVLGMHRSGTSALSRVLNLCGAVLPAKLKPPKLEVNPKGFWEPEAVLDLNVRLMRQLGGDWSRVDFTLPAAGELVDEFDNDARALLASEYGDASTILLKDPRICVLAPLWHEALVAAGYRPVYVVPMRHPLEVARSLNARGDMSVPEGLALWLAYMRRVEVFAASHADVMYLRFTDLLQDWRSVVGRIADRLDVPLDAKANADEVDRFLEPEMRRQQSGEDALDELPDTPVIAAIRALYRDCLAHCDRDARPEGSSTSTGGSVSFCEDLPVDPLATATFVLCIENNAIREQALLLCESIRRFAGRYRRSPILAFAPRPGLGVDEATRRVLADMDVEYVDEPLNTTCLDYAPANRVFAGAFAEVHADTDFLVVLDCDTVFLDEPGIPSDADAAARPVDVKGSATRGPGDPFEDYWARLADMAGIALARLPYMYSTIGNERIRASYNGGLAVTRREKRILSRCAELFTATLGAGIRPYRGSGVNIFASTGHVGTSGSEYWGSSQAALTLAIWAATDRVLEYPDWYNVPLHLIAEAGDVDPRWQTRPPIHLHYHWMFDGAHHEVGLDTLARLGTPADRLAWLARRLPLGGEAK